MFFASLFFAILYCVIHYETTISISMQWMIALYFKHKCVNRVWLLVTIDQCCHSLINFCNAGKLTETFSSLAKKSNFRALSRRLTLVRETFFFFFLLCIIIHDFTNMM